MKRFSKKTYIVAFGACCTATILLLGSAAAVGVPGPTSNTQNIMVTGFWNPTGQMIRPFSTNTWLNPDGWQGADWKSTGFDIYSFFPTPGSYNGTFEVDYQITLSDFENITGKLHPVAIISFGAGAGQWEIECNAKNLNSWVSDGTTPTQPTPNPPDNTQPVNYVRHSSLPVQAIADSVNSNTTINAWVDQYGDMGAYLCEYMGYQGMWYHDKHNTSSDPFRCYAAGFIHVSNTLPLLECMKAANCTISTVCNYLNGVIPETSLIIISIGALIVMLAVAVKKSRRGGK